MKQHLTKYTTNALSLVVYNTEDLYNLRKNKQKLFKTLKELYIFTDEQFVELVRDLNADDVEYC